MNFANCEDATNLSTGSIWYHRRSGCWSLPLRECDWSVFVPCQFGIGRSHSLQMMESHVKIFRRKVNRTYPRTCCPRKLSFCVVDEVNPYFLAQAWNHLEIDEGRFLFLGLACCCSLEQSTETALELLSWVEHCCDTITIRYYSISASTASTSRDAALVVRTQSPFARTNFKIRAERADYAMFEGP